MNELWDSVYQMVGSSQLPTKKDLEASDARRHPDKAASQAVEKEQLKEAQRQQMQSLSQMFNGTTYQGDLSHASPGKSSATASTTVQTATASTTTASNAQGYSSAAPAAASDGSGDAAGHAGTSSRHGSHSSVRSASPTPSRRLRHHHLAHSRLFRHKDGSSFWDDIFGRRRRKHANLEDGKLDDGNGGGNGGGNGNGSGTGGDGDADFDASNISAVSGTIGSTDLDADNPDNTLPTYTQQMADKFMQRFLSVVVPTTTTPDESELKAVLLRTEMQKTRPPFNVQVLSRNTIWILQRLSGPFCLIDQIIILFNWINPVFTLTFMLAATLMILKPITILTFPMFLLCYQVILPAFLKRHPIDPTDGSITEGPQLTKIAYPEPVPELSREFILNLTDLQNMMMLYITPWNYGLKWTNHYLYFKHEQFTTCVFLVSFFAAIFLTIFGAPIIEFLFPMIRLSVIVGLWTFTISCHPNIRTKIQEHLHSEDTRLRWLSMTNPIETKMDDDLKYSEPIEVRQVEVFELQRLDKETKMWLPVGFTNEIYPPNSHLRLNGMPVNGCSALVNVKAPTGWIYINEQSEQQQQQQQQGRLGPKMTKSSSTFSQLSNLALPSAENLLDAPLGGSSKHRRTASGSSRIMTPAAANELYGWYMDLEPETWVKRNYVNEVMDIDEDTKWVYDLVNRIDVSGVTSQGLGRAKKSRGRFRRRRWVRYAIRDVYKSKEGDNDDGESGSEDEDDSNNANTSRSHHRSDLPEELEQEAVDSDNEK